MAPRLEAQQQKELQVATTHHHSSDRHHHVDGEEQLVQSSSRELARSPHPPRFPVPNVSKLAGEPGGLSRAKIGWGDEDLAREEVEYGMLGYQGAERHVYPNPDAKTGAANDAKHDVVPSVDDAHPAAQNTLVQSVVDPYGPGSMMLSNPMMSSYGGASGGMFGSSGYYGAGVYGGGGYGMFPPSMMMMGGYGGVGNGLMGPISSLNQFLFGVQTVIFSLGQAVQIVSMNASAIHQLLESATAMFDHALATYRELRDLERRRQIKHESEQDKKRRRRLQALRWALATAASYAGYRVIRRVLWGLLAQQQAHGYNNTSPRAQLAGLHQHQTRPNPYAAAGEHPSHQYAPSGMDHHSSLPHSRYY
jgi:hypothetical protein